MAITQLGYCTAETNVIAALADKPNAQSGMTAEQLKAKFDAADAAIKGYINDTLVPYINETLAAVDTKLGEHDAAFEEDDEEIAALDSASHTHENKPLLDSYTQTEENVADAVAKKHAHENKEKLDTYDKTQSELLQLGRNPNLLDNWYFLPGGIVNQRGQESYTAGYGLDRWATETDATIAVTDGGLTITSPAGMGIRQTHEAPGMVNGKTATFSILLSNGELAMHTFTIGNLPDGYTVGEYRIYSTTSSMLSIRATSATQHSIVAVKLELGAHQTLAHQDSSGVWLLNAVPNFGEELARCRRFYRRSWTGEISLSGAVGLPSIGLSYQRPCVHWEVPMRAAPTVTIYGGSGNAGCVSQWASGADVSIIGASYISAHGFALNGGGNLSQDTLYAFHYEASAEI